MLYSGWYTKTKVKRQKERASERASEQANEGERRVRHIDHDVESQSSYINNNNNKKNQQ